MQSENKVVKSRMKIGKIWFNVGPERKYVRQLDEMSLLHEILLKRKRLNKFVGDVSIHRIVDGHKLRFTQRQTRSVLLYVEEVENDGTTE